MDLTRRDFGKLALTAIPAASQLANPLGARAQGHKPNSLILQLMKRERYTFPASIELEYDIPAGSNAVTEVARCLAFCTRALA